MYKEELQTKNKTPGINTREFIVLHHTGTKHGTIKGVLNTITKGTVSCHYVVDINGDIYKIGSTDNILWHAGVSEWKGKKNMNNYSIGIEVLGGAGEEFPFAQRAAVKKLIEHLMYTFKIPKDNILRHADLTNELSSKGILWDGISKSRKTDIDKKFYQPKYNSWLEYQNSCLPNKYI